MLRRIPLKLSSSFSYWYLVVINKPATLDMISRHYDFFVPLLPGCESPEQFMSEMEGSDAFLGRVLGGSEGLGILLGYGRANAHAFNRRANTIYIFNQRSVPPLKAPSDTRYLCPRSSFFVKSYRSFCSKKIASVEALQADLGFNNLADELNTICENLKGFDLVAADLLEQFMPPVFMAFKNDPETEELRQAYMKTRQDLSRVLSQKPILETVLTRWMEDAS